MTTTAPALTTIIPSPFRSGEPGGIVRFGDNEETRCVCGAAPTPVQGMQPVLYVTSRGAGPDGLEVACLCPRCALDLTSALRLAVHRAHTGIGAAIHRGLAADAPSSRREDVVSQALGLLEVARPLAYGVVAEAEPWARYERAARRAIGPVMPYGWSGRP